MCAGATGLQASSLQLPAQPVRPRGEPALKRVGEAAGQNTGISAWWRREEDVFSPPPSLPQSFQLWDPLGLGGLSHLGSAPLLTSPL